VSVGLLTAAFDTVECRSRPALAPSCSIRSASVVLYSSDSDHLSDRLFRVVLSTSTSVLVICFVHVPQGSVLGPRIFILYMADLADVVHNCQVNSHSFVMTRRSTSCTVLLA